MNVESKVARYGNSLTIRLPAAVARELDFRDGDGAAIMTTPEGLFIARSQRSRLAQRLATVRAVQPEVKTGRPVGAENE